MNIISGRRKGKVELEFYNTDDLTALLDLLEQISPKQEGGSAL